MKNIAIVTWWISKERVISLASAQTYIKYLDTNKYHVEVFDIPSELEEFINKIYTFDIVFPILHGIGWEDGQISALCEMHGIPVFFTSSQSHQLCIDKYLSTTYLKSKWILAPKTSIIDSNSSSYTLQEWEKAFIKPVHGWSSIDSNICTRQSETDLLISKILTYDQALVQEYIQWQEFTVSIVWDRDKEIEVYAVGEIITWQSFFDYEAKYSLKNTQEVTPAKISTKLEDMIIDTAIRIYQECKLTCLARIDFIYQDAKLYFLEVNTIPGFTEMSLFPQAIKQRGLEIREFLDSMIERISTNIY
jgi:D-alanine-D-alanine ligase